MALSDLDKELRDTVLRCAFRRTELGVVLFDRIDQGEGEGFLLEVADEMGLLNSSIEALLDPGLTEAELFQMISVTRNNHSLEKITLTSDQIEEIFLSDDRITLLRGLPGSKGDKGDTGGTVIYAKEAYMGKSLLKVQAIVDDPQPLVGKYIRADATGLTANPALAEDYTGPKGNNAWTMVPVYGEPEEDGSVFATYSYVDGEGDKPANDGGVILNTEGDPVDFRGATGAGSPGAPGASGSNGWQLGLEFPTVGGKNVLRAGAWFGGTGTAPASVEGQYLGPDGWTASLAEATAIGSTASGISKYIRVRVAQLTNLAGTYDAGEITGSGSALSVDGTTIEVDDIVLLGGQANPVHNGPYICTVAGDPWTLVRHESFSTDVSARLFVAAQVLSGTYEGLTFAAALDQADFEIGVDEVSFYQSKPHPLNTSQLTEPREHLLRDEDGEVAHTAQVEAVQSAVDTLSVATGAPFVLTTDTADDTPVDVEVLVPDEDSVGFIEVDVVAARTGGTAGSAGDFQTFKLTTSVTNIGGTVAIGEVVSGPSFGEQDWTVGLSVTGGDTVSLSVTGGVDTNISWRIVTRTSIIAYAE